MQKQNIQISADKQHIMKEFKEQESALVMDREKILTKERALN